MLSPQCSRPGGWVDSQQPAATVSAERHIQRWCKARHLKFIILKVANLALPGPITQPPWAVLQPPTLPTGRCERVRLCSGGSLPSQSRSWTFLPVFLPDFLLVPSPSTEPVCCRCVSNGLGPDAAYLEPIITASAPLVCHLRRRAETSGLSANLLVTSGYISQSLTSFASNDSKIGESGSPPTITGSC